MGRSEASALLLTPMKEAGRYNRVTTVMILTVALSSTVSSVRLSRCLFKSDESFWFLISIVLASWAGRSWSVLVSAVVGIDLSTCQVDYSLNSLLHHVRTTFNASQ